MPMPIDPNTGPLIALILVLIVFLLLIILVEFFINRMLLKENEELERTIEENEDRHRISNSDAFYSGVQHAEGVIKSYTSEEFHHFFNK